MSRKKQRPYTEAERAEVADLCYRSKLGGQLSDRDSARVQELFDINSEEYGEVSKAARDKANSDYRNTFR